MPRRRARFRGASGFREKPGPALSVPRRWAYGAAAFIAAAILFGNGGFRTLVKNTLLLRDIRRQLTQEVREGAELETRIKAVSTDDSAIEYAARKELGYLKPGEVEYRFPPPKKKK